ncbi:MAG: PAS domain S-box protein [Syntrophales bacterium]|nr:PAS domain S-box protein [Syntrophales bacterium]
MSLIGAIRPIFVVFLLLLAAGLPIHSTAAEKIPGTVALTNAERQWLKEHPVIRLAPDPDFKPIEYFDKSGTYQGAAADIIRILEKKLGITITVVRLQNWDEAMNRFKKYEVDLLGAMVRTPDREKFALFTDTLVAVPGGIFTRSSPLTPNLTLKDLKGKRVAVVSNYAAHDIIRNQYPDITLEVVPDVSTGLAKASLGMVDYYVENMANATFYSQEAGITNLQMAGKTEFDYRWGIGIRKDWPELQAILNKGLDAITDEERNQAIQRWIYIEGQHWRPTKAFIIGIIASFMGCLLLLAIYGNYSLRKLVRRRTISLQQELEERQRAEVALKTLASQLEERVLERTAELEREITERMKSEQAAIASEEKFRELFQSVADPVYISDMNGRIIAANDQASLELCYSHEELLEKSIQDLDAIFDAPEKVTEHFRNLPNDRSVTFDSIHRRKDGSLFPVELKVRLVKFNKEISVMGVTRNITERKRAEQEMALLATIGQVIGSTLQIDEVYDRIATEIKQLIPFDSLIVNLCDTAQETLHVAYASGLEMPDRLLGDTFPIRGTLAEEAIRTRRGVLVQSENPEDLVEEFPSLIVSVRAGMHSVMSVPLIFQNKVIGNLIMRSIKPIAYTEQDLHLAEKIGMQITGAIANAKLFSELSRTEKSLRESEGRFRTLVEQAAVGVAEIDIKSGRFLTVNHRLCEIVGRTKKEMLATAFQSITHPEDLHLHRDKTELLLTGKIEYYSMEKRYVRKNGKIIWVNITVSPLWKPGEKPGRNMIVAEDITDRKQADAERRSLEERLQRAEKMEALGQMAGGVAHDLNNVLGILSGYSELLLVEIPKGSRSRDYVEKILQSTEKGAAIIQDLLTLARRGVISSDVINLNRVASDFLKTPAFEKMKEYHPRVTFKTEYDKNLLNIRGSPVHLEKTLMNLVSNAAEAISGMGEVTIRTESRYLDKHIGGYDEVKEGDYAILTVSDTGAGIPAEDLGKIFEPFYTKKTMGRSGTGLGLTIVWGTVKDHNGYIDVQTEVGQGTTFTLYFPVIREDVIAPQQKVQIEQYMGKGESILVVDDISEQGDVAARLLTRLGYEVHVVSSGEEAMEYLKGNNADILVLDMIMTPGIDGLETYQRVLEISPKQKAILVSGFSQTERVKEAQRLGAGTYVKKPYMMEKIGMAIRDELDKNR